MAVIGTAEAENHVQHGTDTAAVGTDNRDMGSRLDGEVEVLDEADAPAIAKGELAPDDAGALGAGGMDLAVLAFDFEVHDVAELVHGGHGVVPGFEFLAELHEVACDACDDELTGDELTEGELLTDDKVAADSEESGAGQDLDGKESADLSEDDAEMATAGVDVVRGKLVGAIHGEFVSAGAFEEHGELSDLLEPMDDLVLRHGFIDGGADGTPTKDENDQDEHDGQHGGKSKEVGVEEAQEDHADQATEDDVDAVQQEERRAFLDGGDVEESIDQLRCVDAVQGGGADTGEAVGEVGSDPDKEPPLDDIGDVVLKALHNGGNREGDQEGCSQDEQRLNVGGGLSAEGEIADHGIDGQGGGEEEDARDDTEEEEEPDVGHLSLEQGEKSLGGSDVRVGLGVAMAVVAQRGAGEVSHRLGGTIGVDNADLDLFVGAAETKKAGQLLPGDGTPVPGVVAVSDAGSEPAGVADDDPAFTDPAPCDDRGLGSRLPNGLAEGHAGGFDRHGDLGGSGDELLQGLLVFPEGVLNGDANALLIKSLIGHAGELTEGAEPAADVGRRGRLSGGSRRWRGLTGGRVGSGRRIEIVVHEGGSQPRGDGTGNLTSLG